MGKGGEVRVGRRWDEEEHGRDEERGGGGGSPMCILSPMCHTEPYVFITI